MSSRGFLPAARTRPVPVGVSELAVLAVVGVVATPDEAVFLRANPLLLLLLLLLLLAAAAAPTSWLAELPVFPARKLLTARSTSQLLLVKWR